MSVIKSRPDKFRKLAIVPFKIKHEYEDDGSYSPTCKHCGKCDCFGGSIYDSVYYQEQDIVDKDTSEIKICRVYYCKICVKDKDLKSYIQAYVAFGENDEECEICHKMVNNSLKLFLDESPSRYESLHEYDCQEVHDIIKHD